jgi:hypothetical protein
VLSIEGLAVAELPLSPLPPLQLHRILAVVALLLPLLSPPHLGLSVAELPLSPLPLRRRLLR